jgi:hypothetical protein
MIKTKARYCLVFIILWLIFLGCSEKPSQENTEKYSLRKMEQLEFITFPDFGVLEIKAQAIEEQLPKLIIRDAAKKILFQLEMGHSDPENYKAKSRIEFQVRHIPVLPDPLLMVVASGSGGSYARFEVALIGIVSGKLKLLWEKFAYDRGGFFVGDLGKNRGIGIAQWFWSSSECQGCEPDTYSIELYLWNGKKAQFDVGPKFIIEEKKFDDIKKLELDFPSQIEDFKRLHYKSRIGED